MASILKINCTKSRYGWKSDAQAAGGETCYAGKVWNGSATRHYDSSLRFIPPNPAPWGDYPVVIKKVTLYRELSLFHPAHGAELPAQLLWPVAECFANIFGHRNQFSLRSKAVFGTLFCRNTAGYHKIQTCAAEAKADRSLDQTL